MLCNAVYVCACVRVCECVCVCGWGGKSADSASVGCPSSAYLVIRNLPAGLICLDGGSQLHNLKKGLCSPTVSH